MQATIWSSIERVGERSVLITHTLFGRIKAGMGASDSRGIVCRSIGGFELAAFEFFAKFCSLSPVNFSLLTGLIAFPVSVSIVSSACAPHAINVNANIYFMISLLSIRRRF